MRRLIVILGVPIDDLNMAETLDRLDEFVVTGRETGKGHQVATVNADFVVKSMTDPELRYLLQEADLSTADGMPLVWGSRLLGVNLEGRVAGADMIPALAQRAAAKGYSIYFLGAAPGIAAKAAEILKEQNPDLIVAGVKSPPYSSVIDMDPAIIAEIKAAQPDILLVAFGNPKQEKWIGMYG
ncbi:MAG: WecB/TagA/CpsF family glycosyltransferase, partial [Candidatus Promineifilaceae bacterium]